MEVYDYETDLARDRHNGQADKAASSSKPIEKGMLDSIQWGKLTLGIVIGAILALIICGSVIMSTSLSIDSWIVIMTFVGSVLVGAGVFYKYS